MDITKNYISSQENSVYTKIAMSMPGIAPVTAHAFLAYLGNCSMSGTGHPAAEVVRNATHGGYDDWFLPSRDELYEMCWVLQSRRWNGAAEDNPAYGANRVGGFADVSYWISSEVDADSTWAQDFNDGYRNGSGKDNTYRVRITFRLYGNILRMVTPSL